MCSLPSSSEKSWLKNRLIRRSNTLKMIMVWNHAEVGLMSSIRMKKLLNIVMSEIHHNEIE